MAPVRDDVSSKRRIHFHGFGVTRQGPWCTVEKCAAEPIDAPESGSKRPERRIAAPEREPKRPRRGFQRAGCDSRQFVNKDNPPLSSRRKLYLDAVSFAECHPIGGKCQEPCILGRPRPLRACANRRATFRTWHLSEGLNSLLTTAWHIRYSPIGAASKSLKVQADAIPFVVGQVGGISPVLHGEERMPPLCRQGFSRQCLETVLQTALDGLMDGPEITIKGIRYSRYRRSPCHVLDARTPPTLPTKSGTYCNCC
jgi:hypothetical protein